ncbi:MAG: hypothetical protein JXA64_04380 [Candidatus Fermentibacteraceae bacterium]|nr:hypothetical protein [Candidatus Fermentibacteraceae bacterium]MBN2608330.1 hypothetical protein [Candidatus Fermentibacteraceae bacterium]
MKKDRLFRKDRRKDRSENPLEAVKKQLEHIAREGGFKAALLTTEDGFAVADVESNLDSDALAALAGFVWQMNRTAVELTGFAAIDQMTMSGPSCDSVICQSFDIEGEPVVLIVIACLDNAYRDLTDRAVDGIRRIMS